jgi:hypothetical protein
LTYPSDFAVPFPFKITFQSSFDKKAFLLVRDTLAQKDIFTT